MGTAPPGDGVTGGGVVDCGVAAPCDSVASLSALMSNKPGDKKLGLTARTFWAAQVYPCVSMAGNQRRHSTCFSREAKVPRSRARSRVRWLHRKRSHNAQSKLKLTQLAPIIAGPNRQHALSRSCLDRRFERAAHRGLVDPIDHNFIRAVRPLHELRLDAPPQRGAIRIVRRCAAPCISTPPCCRCAPPLPGRG